MWYLRAYRKAITLPLIALMVLISAPMGIAQAAMVQTQDLVPAEATAQSDANRVVISDFLAREDVRDQMKAMGVDPLEAEKRVAALSDTEAAQLASDIKTAPAGEGPIGTIVGAALIVFIILLVTDLLGLTNAFSFTK